MLNIFKRKKKQTPEEPVKLTRDKEIAAVLNRLLGLEKAPEPISFSSFEEVLKSRDSWSVFSLCGNSDRFPHSVLIGGSHPETAKVSHLLNELTGLECLPSSLKKDSFDSLLWSSVEYEMLAGEEKRFMVLTDPEEKEDRAVDCLAIHSSRQFAFGSLLLDELTISRSPISFDFKKVCFNPDPLKEWDYSLFSSIFIIKGREIPCSYAVKGKGKMIDLMVKEIMKKQKERLGAFLSEDVAIKTAGLLKPGETAGFEGFSLEGNIYTTGGPFPYVFLFPKKLINIFPQQECSTVKGKILQLNRELFISSYDEFHKSHDRFLFDDLISLLPRRDLNLICQNFFVSRSMNGDSIRSLFYYRVKLEEKSKIRSIPFTSRDILVNHLPQRLREEFSSSKSYAESLNDLIRDNEKLLEKLYEQVSEGNLLLSPNGISILERETGNQLKESRMLRLKKLMSDKRFLNALGRLDNKKVQILLNGMNHRLITDTFIYQTDQLPLVKPYLSQNRFKELMEDIKFTQEKIKKGQIDINRICDSVESFNREIKLFIEKEREAASRSS